MGEGLVEQVLRRKQFVSEPEMVKLKTRSQIRKEAWLVLLGIILHSVYMLSIFDIYFKTPIVHGCDPVPPRFAGPAKRLVLLVADGLRADKLFELETGGNPRAPFLRTIIEEKGRWGVSHARPPTESRPGHVSLIAGFYEDPSAVTKGWKANPVEFDSVFNRSKHTFAFGSPDVVPIFCGALPHCTFETYLPELEDFATDASFLDEWSFDRFKTLLEQSHEDEKLKGLLSQENIVIFLHLFGCDSNGHAYRPHSSVYHNNVKVVDSIAERVYHLLEKYYNDDRTSYIFTSDHGMSDKGSHGDGHPTNTETPLVVWGAGVKYPKLICNSNNSETLENWGLRGVERLDVNQADIAPLMSTLLGLPIPVNSVGNLPVGYINMSKSEEVEALLSNTKEILSQFLRKSQIKQSNALFFKPFKLPTSPSSMLQQIDSLTAEKNYESAMLLAKDLKSLALEGLDYFQTYDWFMLMSVVSLGYLGFIIYLLLHVLRFYSNEKTFPPKSENHKVHYVGSIFMAVISIVLVIEHSPLLYHAYFATTIFLWTQIFADLNGVKQTWKLFHLKKAEIILTVIISVSVAEFLVHSFTRRELYTWCFVAVGIIGSYFLHKRIPFKSRVPIFVCLCCWLISPFTLMPPEIPSNNNLVIASGGIIIMLGCFCRWIDVNYSRNKFMFPICCYEKKSSFKLFLLQASLVGCSSAMVGISTSHRTENKELHSLHQIINWTISGVSLILPFLSEATLLSRFNSIFLGFAPPFLLLSIGYEALFYAAFAALLVAWILFEIGIRPSKKDQFLQLSDSRIPLTFMVLFNLAFFGTGNFASIASFEISSVYRFITVFSPFLMAALLIFKLFIPFMLVICAFSAVTKSAKIPRLGCYFLVILFSDLMTIHFFFLVRNTGSWMEIGNSISHFGIMSAQVIFVLLLFAITNAYTSRIHINSHSQ